MNTKINSKIIVTVILLSVLVTVYMFKGISKSHYHNGKNHDETVAATSIIEAASKIHQDKTNSDKPQARYLKSASDDEIGILSELLDDEDFYASQDAAEGLVKYGKRAVPILCKKIPGASARHKGQMIFILGRIGDKDATPVLIDALSDENAYIRRNAARALGRLRDRSATEALVKSLTDKNYIVRADAALSLGEMNGEPIAGSLIDAMSHEKEELVKSAVVDAFAKLRDANATPLLLDELKKGNDLLYKNKLIYALGEIGDGRALAQIVDYRESLMAELEKEDNAIYPDIKYHIMEAKKIADTAIEKIEKGINN